MSLCPAFCGPFKFIDFYKRNMTGNVPTKANSFHVLSTSCKGGNALNFMNINIVFTFRHMDQNICRLVNLLVLKNKIISTVQWNILWSWVKHEQDNFLIGWPHLARVNSRASFGAMLKRALGQRFAALGMLVAEMFKTLIYLDVKIFNISNKNYLGIAWNLYVVK